MILSAAIGSVTTIVMVFHVLSLRLPAPTAVIAFADATAEETKTEDLIGSYLSFPARPSGHDHNLRGMCPNRSAVARLSKRNKGPELRKLVARAKGPTNHKALATRYHAEKGSGYGQLNQRHPFCASKLIAAPRFHRDRAPDAGARDRNQCSFILRC